MSRNVSRRSWFVGGMSVAARAWLALGGALGVAGCGDDTPAPGDMARPIDKSTEDAPVVKYGGPPDLVQPLDQLGPIDQAQPGDMPVVKYGGPPDMAAPMDMPVVKYGGPPDLA